MKAVTYGGVTYESPVAETVYVETEGCFASSPVDSNDMNGADWNL